MSPWGSEVVLGQEEKVVESWEGSRVLIEKKLPPKKTLPEKKPQTDKPAFEEKKQQPLKNRIFERKIKAKEWREGVLVLTTERLIFVDEKKQRIDDPEGRVIAVPLRTLVEMWRERLPTKVKEPVKVETFVFELPKMGKKEFEDFKEKVFYCSQAKLGTRKVPVPAEAKKANLIKIK